MNTMNPTCLKNASRPTLLPTVFDTEEAQIQRAAAGDEAAYRLIVERYHGLVFRVIAEIVRDDQQAEDLAQECFMSAYRNLRTLEEPRAFKRWLTTIAKHLALRARRVRVRALRVEMPGDKLEHVAFDSGVHRAADVSEQVAERIGATDAQGWLASLPECYRSALSLRFLQNLSYQEIAAALGIKLGTVKFRLSHGVALLKEFALAA